MGVNGRVSDGGVWNRTGLCSALENGEINLPLPEPLPNRTEDCPYVIVGDDAPSLKPFLTKLYPQRDLGLERRVCRYRLSRAGKIVENVFWPSCQPMANFSCSNSPSTKQSRDCHNGHCHPSRLADQRTIERCLCSTSCY